MTTERQKTKVKGTVRESTFITDGRRRMDNFSGSKGSLKDPSEPEEYSSKQ
jgi:hypothetical protein